MEKRINLVLKNAIKITILIAKLRHFKNKIPRVRKSNLGKHVSNQASKITECAKKIVRLINLLKILYRSF